jgi:hypothetical protein
MVFGGMRLLTCLDREEYLWLTDGWLAHLAILQGALPLHLKVNDPLVGLWCKCQVEVVSAGSGEQAEAVKELEAIYALQGDEAETMYWRVQAVQGHRQAVGKLVSRHELLQEFCFRQMALPRTSPG